MTGYLTVKNWEKFQHYKKRNPPWIRLYRTLLDEQDWRNLSSGAAKLLVELWLLASEGEESGRVRDDSKWLAWRLRVSNHKAIETALEELATAQFITRYPSTASGALASRTQGATPETETETETEQRQIGKHASLVRLPKKGGEAITSERALAAIAEFATIRDARTRAAGLEDIRVMFVHQYWAAICAKDASRQMVTSEKVGFIRPRLQQAMKPNMGGVSTLLYAVDGALIEPRLNQKDGSVHHDVDNIFRNWSMVQRCAEQMAGYREGREHKMVTEHPEIRDGSAEAV